MAVVLREFYLKTALILLANAAKYMEQFRIESGAQKNDKLLINHWIRKIMSVEGDICSITTPEFAKAIRTEVSENWDTLAIQNVLGMMVELSNEDRVHIENLVETIYNESKQQKDEDETVKESP